MSFSRDPARRVPAVALALVVALGASGCGADPVTVMPDVRDRRLDIALSDIKRAGFPDDVEVVGGGVFGIVDESNWTVCDQAPAPGKDITVAPLLSVNRDCSKRDRLGNSDDESGDAKPKRAKRAKGRRAG